jgi:hypothetical protein
MAFGRIPLDFESMRRAYKFHDRLNDGTPVGEEVHDWITAQNKLEAEKGLTKSTTCCMQASMGFNVTRFRIPIAGAVGRDNTKGAKTGNYYILSVAEFRAWLTYTFGPTAQVKAKSEVPGDPGVVIFGNAHIEFWDGKEVLQAPPRMNGSWMWSQSPIWFWHIGAGMPASGSMVPDWLVGWWTVYNGTYYYYYFNQQGLVTYIEKVPNPKWTPPMTIGNQGRVQMGEHGPKVTWEPVGHLPATVEEFTRLGWTSETEMNGTSNNNYAQLFARKM